MKFFIAVWFCLWIGIKLQEVLSVKIAWMRHIAYGRYVLLHKWYVFQECLKLGVPLWIAILHDWDKFLPDEWLPYARTFYAEDGTKQYIPEFDDAWLKHQNRNKHHWQYWMITWDKGNTECLPMPDVYRREMLADWRGAGRAITGEDNTLDWYTKNYDNIKLHSSTRVWFDEQLGYQPPKPPEEFPEYLGD